jgi:branched-chain amino acid transport system substrate-binding protein
LAAPPTTLRVAAVFNLTGSMASVDRPGYDGMKLAAEQLNASKKIKVELVPVDGQSDPVKAANALRAALRKGRFQAVAGLYDSDYAIPVGKVAQRARIPFVTSGATLPGLPNLIGNYAFMACYGDDDQARAMAKFARQVLQANTAAGLTDPRHAYTQTVGKEFRGAFVQQGGRWLMTINDPQPGAGEPLKFGSDAVYAATLPDDAGKAVRRLRAGGFEGAILSGDGFDTPDLPKDAGQAAYKVFFTTHVAFDSQQPLVRAFVRDYKARFKRDPESAAAALSYDTLRLIAHASMRGGRLRDAIAATRGFDGVTGTISYTPGSREPVKPVSVVEVLGGTRTFRASVENP